MLRSAAGESLLISIEPLVSGVLRKAGVLKNEPLVASRMSGVRSIDMFIPLGEKRPVQGRSIKNDLLIANVQPQTYP